MIIIGERINATNKGVAAAINNRDAAYIQRLARSQAEAGADYIDVNAATGHSIEQEIADLKWLIDAVSEAVDKPLCIDSSNPQVLVAAIDYYRNPDVLVNSVNAEPHKLDAVGSAVAGRGLSVIALLTGEAGIPRTVEERMVAAERIADRLTTLGVKQESIYFDPLALPISVDVNQGMVTLKTIEQIKKNYPTAKTAIGISNISYGLPCRRLVNRAFLLMAAAAGLDVAILDPTDASMMSAVRSADLLVGKDPSCRGFIRAYRQGQLTE